METVWTLVPNKVHSVPTDRQEKLVHYKSAEFCYVFYRMCYVFLCVCFIVMLIIPFQSSF